MKIRFITLALSLSAMTMAAVSCSHDKAAATPEPPIRVRTVEIHPTTATASQTYSGTVEESAGTSVSFAAAGTIRSLNVQAGDRVAAGQVIGTLDKTTLQNSYDIARATLDQARDAHERFKKLHDANSLPDMQWVQIEQALRQAESAEAIAAKALSDAVLLAPSSGYVSEKYMDAGMNVAPGVPVVKIVRINPVKVSIAVTEEKVAQMPLGAGATITVASMPGRSFVGRLTEKPVTANPLTRTYDVKFTVDNPDQQLLPGMICDVVTDAPAATAASAPVYVLPIRSVLLDADNRNFVWLDSASTAVKRIVTVGGQTDAGIIVTSGVATGDKVITDGLQKVSRGTRVTDINASSSQAARN